METYLCVRVSEGEKCVHAAQYTLHIKGSGEWSSCRVGDCMNVCICRITHTFIPLQMFKRGVVGEKKKVAIVKSIQDTRAVPSACGALLHSLTEAIKLWLSLVKYAAASLRSAAPLPNTSVRIVTALCLPSGPDALHFCIATCHRALIYNASGFLALPNNARTVKLSVIFIPKRNINIWTSV